MLTSVICMIIILILSSFTCTKKMLEEFEWGNLRNLGPNINSPGKDEHVSFTQDGKTMYFASIRESGIGNYDIYISDWDGKTWSDPKIFDSTFAFPGKPDWGATFPRDFKTFYFSSGRDPAKPGMVQMFWSSRNEGC